MSTNLVIKNDSFIQSMHNDIQCLSLNNATRPCDRCWFTSKQIQDWADMDRKTLNRRLDKLVSVGRIVGLKEGETTGNIIDIDNDDQTNDAIDTKSTKASKIGSGSNLGQTLNADIQLAFIEDSCGVPHEMKIYNLNVLNHLAMVELDNEKLNAIANKFSDILSEVETTGSYNAIQLDRKTQLQLAIINSRPNSVEQLSAIAALEELHAEEKKALEDQNKVLEAENKDLHDTNDEILNENEIIRGKYHNTKQIYDIIMQEYPEALKQAKTTNYNKLRKALKKLSNEDKESIKIYKKHVTNKQGDIEWRKEYYFVHEILLKILDCVRDNIKYIANIR